MAKYTKSEQGILDAPYVKRYRELLDLQTVFSGPAEKTIESLQLMVSRRLNPTFMTYTSSGCGDCYCPGFEIDFECDIEMTSEEIEIESRRRLEVIDRLREAKGQDKIRLEKQKTQNEIRRIKQLKRLMKQNPELVKEVMNEMNI